MSDIVTVLCAGPGLGFYVPGAIVATKLRAHVRVEVAVIEGLLPPDKQTIVRQSRQAFHRDFRVALMAQRLARDITAELDADGVSAMLRRWASERRSRFVVFSGFWGPVVERYVREHSPADVKIDYCHVDAAPSSSWRLVTRRPPGTRDIWFVSWDDHRLGYWLDVSGEPPLRWTERGDRLLAHGGGWGMGTYRERVASLASCAIQLDVLCYEATELAPVLGGPRLLYLDAEWVPWACGDNWFPPLGEVDDHGVVRYSASSAYPELFKVIRRAPAMISKPGGGTLVDSFAAATPLILLEPFGDYERKNGLLWKELGFAIEFDEWLAGGCRRDVLARLHDNLIAAREHVTNYADDCLARMTL